MYKIIFSLILLTTFCLSSCEKIVLGEVAENSPERNFDLLWTDLDKSYSLFEAKNIDWNLLYSEYKPQINRTTSEAELWNIISELLEHLDDSHVTLYAENENFSFTSGYTLNEQSKQEYSKSLITDKYLEQRIELETEDNFSYGKIKNKNIGYIYLGSEGGSNAAIIDDILKNINNHKAIIFDIRQNTGGDDRYAARVAGAFADKEELIYSVQTRNGINHTDFDEKKFYSTKRVGSEQFLKPVILLTDRKTISAGEIFCLHMKSFEHITQIGDTTAGDFATLGNRSFLPNGWSFRYPIQLFLRPNGDYLDGKGGNIPDVFIKNTALNIASDEDLVLEKAIEYLFEVYDIE